ncbi:MULTISPECIES: KilA-N domain-containing protein [Candidatus Regiella]|uniref:KilA-N domain-containing protein n=1 Tax=Candidatus Regiella TaxID=568988 RepID=UPI0002E90F00|nr:KilA-N domain-containing protein [Candidatus Regiella insecticola]
MQKYNSTRIELTDVIRGGSEQETFAYKELIYAYAMWISAAFNLKVIRTFDKAVIGNVQPLIDQV